MSTIFAFLIALPVLIVKVFLKRPILIILLVVGIGAIIQLQRCSNDGRVEIPDYQENAPKAALAGTVFDTSSRVYYAVRYQETDPGSYLLTEYYTYRGKKWILGDHPLPLDERYYGRIKVYENTN